MKEIVDHHASVVIVESQERGKFLFVGYDGSYPVEEFRGHANLLGGNYELGDTSPRGLLERELTEEFDVREGEEGNFAPRDQIYLMRDQILGNLRPFADFLIIDPIVRSRKTQNRRAILSVFQSRMSARAFDYAEHNIGNGQNILTEGYPEIASLDDLIQGKVLLAWASPVIMSVYLNAHVPNYLRATATNLGAHKESFREYLKDFDYVQKIDMA